MTDQGGLRGSIRSAGSAVTGARIGGQVDHLLAEAERVRAHIRFLESQMQLAEPEHDRWRAMEAELPEILHSVSVTTGALRRLEREVATLVAEHDAALARADALAEAVHELWGHVRTVRAEVLHEIQRTAGRPESTSTVESKVVDAARLDALRADGPLRVNLGCGHLPLDGYVNVDMRELPGVDVVAGLDDLPFEPGSLGEVFSAHVMEHFTVDELTARLLPHWTELLAPGGEFRAVVPDGPAMAASLVAGTTSFEEYSAVLMGGQEYLGDFHLSVFSAESLGALLTSAGLVDVEVVATARPLDICFEMELRARRPT